MRTCIVCRCTDERACEEGCSWARKIGKNEGLCTACPDPVSPKKLTAKQRAQRKKLSARVFHRDQVLQYSIDRAHRARDEFERGVEQLRDFERAMAGT
jgi:hypothetical protein